MRALSILFEKNKAWADRHSAARPGLFPQARRAAIAEYLWIGCSDSRVPANEIVGLLPGELFVHRNVANVVVHTDLNCLSVMQFAVDVLKVKHIIVCGHYGCSGVRAALRATAIGLADNWLRHVQDVRQQARRAASTPSTSEAARIDRLCELNVIEQVANVCQTTIVRRRLGARAGAHRPRLDLWAEGRAHARPQRDRDLARRSRGDGSRGHAEAEIAVEALRGQWGKVLIRLAGGKTFRKNKTLLFSNVETVSFLRNSLIYGKNHDHR